MSICKHMLNLITCYKYSTDDRLDRLVNIINNKTNTIYTDIIEHVEELLEQYAKCKNGDEVIKTQNEFLEAEAREEANRKNAEIDLPPMESSDTDETSDDE